MDFPELLDPSRSAASSLESYLYQIYLTLENWLELTEDEYLRCEGDEDIDRFVTGSHNSSTQVKRLAGPTNLKDAPVLKTLRHFLVSHTHLRRNGDFRKFVFVTTAARRHERGREDPLALLNDYKNGDCDAGQRLIDLLQLEVLPAGPNTSARLRASIEESFRWLNAESTRWFEFIDSIQFNFEAPALPVIRKRLLQHTTVCEAGAPKNLLEFLVARVLTTCGYRDPAERVLSREDLAQTLDGYRANLEAWLMTPEAMRIRNLVEDFDGDRRISRWLDNGIEELPPMDLISPAQLLTARYQAVPFNASERSRELALLEEVTNSDTVILLLTGKGGTGKTRLAQEWCSQLRLRNWHAGFLYRDLSPGEIERLGEGSIPRFVVVDYAESRTRQIESLIRIVALQSPGAPSLRLLLLSRRAGDWWDRLASNPGTEAALAQLARVQPIQEGPREPAELFKQASIAMAAALNVTTPTVDPPTLFDSDTMLLVQMAALNYVLGGDAGDASTLIKRVLNHEKNFWWRQIRALQNLPEPWAGIMFDAMAKGMAIATLWGGIETEEQAVRIIDRAKPEARRYGIPDTCVHLLARLYKNGTKTLGALEPDVLGEHHIAGEALEDRSLLSNAITLGRTSERRQTLTVLGRHAQQLPEHQDLIDTALSVDLDGLVELAAEVAVETGDPVGPVLASNVAARCSLDSIRQLASRLTEDLQHAPSLQEVKIAVWSRLASEDIVSQLRYCESLHEAGRFEEAKQILIAILDIEEAAAQGTETQRLLAVAERALSNALLRLGQHLEASKQSRNSIERLRNLDQSIQQIRLDLSLSLSAHGLQLALRSDPREGLKFAEEAVSIRRRLADERFLEYHSLTMSKGLQNLGIARSKAGRPKDAIGVNDEAIAILRYLVERHPGQHQQDLALMLLDHTSDLVEAQDCRRALVVSRESMEIFRNLANSRESFRSLLASAIANHAFTVLNCAADEAEANSAEPYISEAISMFRSWVSQDAPKHQYELTSCLHTQGCLFLIQGKHSRAAHVLEEAISIRRDWKLKDQAEEERIHELLERARAGQPCVLADLKAIFCEAEAQLGEI